YQEILKQAEIGIMTVNDKGHVLFANPTVKKMFNTQQLNHLRQLERVDKKLFSLLSNLEPIDRKLFQLTNERETVQMLIKSTEVKLNEKPLQLVIVQDINNELDQKETDSWMKLIRVLTHEIMNSVAPITSISQSILGYYKTDEGIIAAEDLNEKHISNTVKGLEVIKSQGDDLMSFVKSYRSVLSVPEPEKKPINVVKLLEKLEVLFSEEISPDNVSLEVYPQEIELFADEKQITLVLINLLKNATQALTAEGGTIKLSAGVNDKSQKYIQVKDNGPGIPSDVLDQIFVPFFTTKDDGSGIGLSLSKQIMQIHGGGLSVRSEIGVGSSFLVWFG
ncbi:MAG: PAS domain-containing sensor histidine kinase, partial [Flavobacteriales bacterium]